MALIKPVTGSVTQAFGCTGFSWEPAMTWHGVYCEHFHGGIDYGAPSGSPIYAAANGYVLAAGWDIPISIGGGYSVWLRHSDTLETVYAHCSQLLVSRGQQVTAGQVIAKVGSTGNSTGPHLHFAVWTTTATWGHQVDDPNKFYVGGSDSTTYLANMVDDIPWLEPFSGTLVSMALCNRTATGLYALPTKASQVKYVYFDRIMAQPAMYTIITNSDGSLFIDPVEALDTDVEVRADYVI
jgi:murein DD-endopeptidase MepM/ murein hydrolase activator NlpD